MHSFSTKGGHSMDKVVKTYGLSTVGPVFMEKFGNVLGFSTRGGGSDGEKCGGNQKNSAKKGYLYLPSSSSMPRYEL